MSSNNIDQEAANEGGEQQAAVHIRDTASTRGDEAVDGSSRPKDVADPGTDVGERPTKRMKRAKYATRACTSCQQRKIKCDGYEPCGQCVAKYRTCVSAPRKHEARQDLKSRFSSDSFHGDPNISLNREILARLATAERQLRMLSHEEIDIDTRSSHGFQRRRLSTVESNEQGKPTTTEFHQALELEGQTFAGELSIAPALGQDNHDDSGQNGEESSPGSAIRPLDPTLSESGSRQIRGWLEKIFTQHGVVADEQQLRYDLQVYMEEVHPLYAFLHPPTVWETFYEMWEYSALWSMTDSTERREKHISVAIVCFCIALGRCSVTSRMSDESGVYSSGFGMYSVGMALLQNVMDMGNVTTKSLPTLQVLILRVIYLFRLDANQQASRVLALLISIAHATGLHRQNTLDAMPVFYSQLHCRVWWVIYALDRRIALESGKPYIIQNSNVDTALPLDLSDDWLSRFHTREEIITDLQSEISKELARDSPKSAVPYMIALVRYSRAAGKAWEILYGVKASSMSASAMVDYVDTVLGNLVDTVPEDLRYNPNLPCETQFSKRSRWQIKQTMLLFTCCTYVRVLIRRPFMPMPRSPYRGEDDELESTAACASLAASVLTAHQKLNDHGIKHSFALSHYITSCTMIMIGLVSREPGFKKRYGDLLLAATRSLNMYCHEVWVSGKMMRLVLKLTRLVQRTLGQDMPNSERTKSHAGEVQDDVVSNTHQQLTPQSEHQEPRRPSQLPASSMLASRDMDDSIQQMRDWDPDDCAAKAHTLTTNATEREYVTEDGPQTRMFKSWIDGSSSDERANRVMSDFDFGTIIDGHESYGSDIRPSNMLADRSTGVFGVGNAREDRDFGEFRLGVLGLNSITDLDAAIDPSMMDLGDHSAMIDLDGLR